MHSQPPERVMQPGQWKPVGLCKLFLEEETFVFSAPDRHYCSPGKRILALAGYLALYLYLHDFFRIFPNLLGFLLCHFVNFRRANIRHPKVFENPKIIISHKIELLLSISPSHSLRLHCNSSIWKVKGKLQGCCWWI